MDIDYRRWWTLGIDLLSAPTRADSVAVVGRELCAQLGARGAAVVDVEPSVAVRPVGEPCADPLDVGWYTSRARHLPLVALLRSARFRYPVAGPTSRGARADVVERVQEDGVDAALAVPLVGPASARWLVLLRRQPFSTEELDLVDHAHRLLRSVSVPAGGGASGRNGVLTARERAVLMLMAEGLVADAIGRRLGVSRRTVTKHQEHIYRKLSARDRLSAVLHAQAAGLLVAQS